jgi:hypothetical protein
MRIARTALFERAIKKLGASAAEILALEAMLATDPERGDVIAGLEGARKLRFAMGGRGKRGGGRAIYVVVYRVDSVYLLTAYSKSRKSDLTEDDKRVLRPLIKDIRNG